MTLDTRLYEGNRAREILESDVFNGAFDAIEAEVIEKWKNSPARDIEGRDRLWLMLALLQKVKVCLQSTMDTGKLAAKELEYERSMSERVKQLFR